MNYAGGGEQPHIVEQHCRELFDIGYWECDLSAETVEFGPDAREFASVGERRELTLESWLAAFHPDERERLAARLREVASTDVVLNRRVRMSRDDGDGRVLHLRADASGQQLQGVVRDVTAQRAREQRLKRAETMFENTEDAMFVIGVATCGAEPTFVIERVNQKYEELLRIGASEVEGKRPREVFGETAGESVVSRFRECVSEREVLQYEERFGDEREPSVWETRLAPVVVDGEVTQLLGTTRDITDQKERKRELQEVTEQLELAVEGAELGIWDWDLQTDSFECNRQWADIAGVDPKVTETSLDIDEWESRIHPDDYPGFDRAMAKHLNGETEMCMVDYRLRAADGDWRWVRTKGEIVERTSTGEPERMVGVLVDIDDRKRAERALREEREMFAQGPVVLFKWQDDAEAGWPVEYVSENVEEIFGYTPEEFYRAEVSYAELLHEADIDRVRNRVRQNSGPETEQFQHDPYRLITADGEVRWVMDYTKNIRDEEGAIVERLGYIVDITERKEREVRLEQAEAAGEFGTWKWNKQTGTVWWSDGVYEVFEQPRDQDPFSYEELVDQIHPEDKERAVAEWEAAVGEHPYDDEFRVQLDEVTKWVRVRSVINADEDGDVVSALGIFKDITEQKKREMALERLVSASRRLLALETVEQIVSETATVAADTFGATASGVYLYDEEEEALVSAEAAGPRRRLHEGQVFTPSEGQVWNVFASQSPTSVDCRSDAPISEPGSEDEDGEYGYGTTLRCEHVFPLGTHGVLILSYEEEPCSRQIIDLADVLANTTGAALDRAERVGALRSQQQELLDQIDTLKQRLTLHNTVRRVASRASQADAADEIRQITCQQLSSVGMFDAVWFGRPDPTADQVEPIVDAAMPADYLEEVPLEIRTPTPSPAARAVRDKGLFKRENIAKAGNRGQWQNIALVHGFQSVASIPIRQGDVLYGVLTIYSRSTNVFDEETTKLLRDIGQFIGHTLKATEQRNSLYGEQTAKLTFSIDPVAESTETGGLYTLCNELSAAIAIKNVSQRHERSHLVHAQIDDADPEQVQEIAAETEGIDEVNHIADSGENLYEIVTVGGCIAARADTVGAAFHSSQLSSQSCEIQYTIPADRDVQEFVNQVQNIFQTANLEAKQKSEPSVLEGPPSMLGTVLTDKQQTTLRTAYHSGYFDKKRKRTGAEIAESLGIAQPTFSKHLRAGQRNLLSAVWD